jgi:TIR domain
VSGQIPPDLQAAITNPNFYARRGAVQELQSLLASEDLQVAARAYEALAELARTDIRYVADPASAALGQAAVRPEETELHFGEQRQGSDPPHRMVRLLGPPIARACVPRVSHDWIGVTEIAEGFDITVDTTNAGTLRGSLDLNGPTGGAAITIDAEVLSLPPRTEQETSEQVERQSDTAPVSAAEAQAELESRVQVTQLRRPKVFLCYRREDTQGFARGIYESLAGKYGHEQVFRDIDSTPAGVKYSAWIESRVGQCSVMIVLIGNAWLSAKDHAGQQRLNLSTDWVRHEIEVALRGDIPIIPVRIQGAAMPSEDELPPSIADLAGFQSAEVADSRWAFDMGQLIQAIDNLVATD